MDKHPRNQEDGQSIVVLALMLVVFLAFVALALDGGNTYVRKRQAQTAADAGALAGARQLCETGEVTPALNAAQEYAVTRNGSDTANVSVDLNNGRVKVDTIITFDTFLAHLIGRPQIQVAATATAECQAPGAGEGIIPTAWACKPPVGSEPTVGGSCIQQAITPEKLDEYLNNPPPECSVVCPELYIIMNSDDTGTDYCHDPDTNPAGPIDCDFDNDGENDLLATGDRSWLNLDGGGNSANEMVGWIEDGFNAELFIHTWFAGNPGVQTNVFQAVEEREGELLIMPVFDELCGGAPSAAGPCATEFHPGQDTVVAGSGPQTYFHVIAFSIFYVSCVDSGGSDSCPGHDAAVAAGMDHNEKTIEGYFIEGTLPGLGGGGSQGLNVGAYVVFLIE